MPLKFFTEKKSHCKNGTCASPRSESKKKPLVSLILENGSYEYKSSGQIVGVAKK